MNLTKLEKKLLIERKENPNNKRQKLVSLTKKGEKLLFNVTDVCNPHDIPELLTKIELETFIKLMNKVQKQIKKMEESSLKFIKKKEEVNLK